MKINRGLKLIIVFVAIVVVGFIVWQEFFKRQKMRDIDENNLPKIIQADWIDLSRISHISKFRSGSGHDFSGSGEKCRSMKHYFNAKRTKEDQNLIDKNNGYPPSFTEEGAISIYSPVDGKIIDIAKDGKMGSQVYIQSDDYPDFTVRLFHIFLIDKYKEGSKVMAGEQIGNIGRIQNTDIAISVGSPHRGKLVSYFQVMPDEIFAKYQTAGIKSRNQLIITKEYRDTHPLQCDGEQFAKNYDSSADEFVFIEQYHE